MQGSSLLLPTTPQNSFPVQQPLLTFLRPRKPLPVPLALSPPSIFKFLRLQGLLLGRNRSSAHRGWCGLSPSEAEEAVPPASIELPVPLWAAGRVEQEVILQPL